MSRAWRVEGGGRGPLWSSLLAASVLYAPTLSALPAGEPDVDLLRAALAPSAGQGRRATLDQLVALGNEGVAPLFSLVTGTGLETLLGTDERAPDFVVPVGELDELALEALGRLPRKVVMAHLERSGGKTATPQERVGVIRVLGTLGEAEGLGLLVSEVEELGPAARVGSIAGHVHEALVRILLDDPRGFVALREALEGVSRPTLGVALAALADTPHPRGADLLIEHFGGDPGVEAIALRALVDMAVQYPWSLERLPLGELQARLASPSSEVRLAVVDGLRRLHDPRGVEGLLRALGDTNARVAQAAQKALMVLFAEREEHTFEAWQALYKQEQAWWADGTCAPLQELAAASPERVLASLRVLLRHPLYREEVALHVSDLLAELDREALPGLCGIVTQLASRRPVPELVTLVASGDPAVRAAAHAALGELTGWNLPPEPWPWQQALGGR